MFDWDGGQFFCLLIEMRLVFFVKEGNVLSAVAECVVVFFFYPLFEQLAIDLDRTKHCFYIYC